jgi:hypothetical protein
MSVKKSILVKREENFEISYKEHLHSLTSNNTNSKFVQRLLEKGYALVEIEDIMEIKSFARK